MYHVPCNLAGSAGLGPGRVQQAFAFSLKEDMTEYYRLIAVLQAQLNLDAEGGGGGSATAGGTEGLTLQRLFVWVMDPLKRLNVMATLVSSAAQLTVSVESNRVELNIIEWNGIEHDRMELNIIEWRGYCTQTVRADAVNQVVEALSRPSLIRFGCCVVVVIL